MKKKVFSLMMTLLLAFVGVARADELTVNDGTATNGFVPVYGFYADAYNKCEFVQPAADLADMNGGTINGMTFYASQSSASWGSANFQVFLTEVASTSISGFAGPGTVVYEGALSISGGEMTVTFTTPYTYNGGNLLVGVYQTATGSYVTSSWYGVSATGASGSGYNYSSLSGCSFGQKNFLPKTTYDYTAGGGGGGGAAAGDQIFAVQDGDVVDTVFVGPRPNGCWMEPFTFQIRNTGANTTITNLDWTPQEYFTLVAPELPVQIARDEDIDVQLTTGTSSNTEWQMVAIYGQGRTAAIWAISAEPYDPAIPDVWEMAHDLGTVGNGFSYQGIPSQITPTELHNDYTLPFPEIEEGEDAVYKFTVATDMILDAYVDENVENGKVALYTEDFNGEGGPMATNNYTGLASAAGGGAASGPFEAQIGEGTTTTGYFPFYTLYNYSISENLFLAAELEEAGVTNAPMTSLSWYATNAPGYAQQGISIWMANVDDEALTTTSHPVTGMTLVYTGAMTPAIGWNEFVFNEGSFSWDGSSNVLIYCQRNNGAWNSTVNWQATSGMNFNCMAYQYQDSGAYDATVANTMSTSTIRPNIIMKGGNRGGNRDVVLNEGFEGGSMPAGWTQEGPGTWYVGSGDYSTSTGSATGTYNALITHGTTGNITYLVTPAMDLSNATSATVSCNYVNRSWAGDYDGFAICYRVNGGAWNELFVEPSYHSVWNNSGEITLTGLAANYQLGFRFTDAYGYGVGLDDVVVNATMGNNGGNTAMNMSAGPVIENLAIAPGTYYLVASATEADYTVYINVDNMPCPIIADADGNTLLNPEPADNADGIEPNSVTLRWMAPEYATGWRLIFGTTYYPDPNHPQTIMYPEDGSFTDHAMATSFTVRNLWNNTNYFWRVEFNNDACPDGVSSPVWGFTTHLNVPQNLTAVDETVFDDEQIVLNWSAVQDRTYRKYFIYRDDVKIGETTVNQIGETTYTDGPLDYNMGGYTYYVTAIYDEGESAPSNTVNVKVSGRGNVNGHVFEMDGETGIANATVTMVGTDEFNVTHTYNFTTDAQGYYSGAVYAGSYNGSASCNGYQTISEPVQGNPIGITYNVTTSPIDYVLDENFDPVCSVIAEYYPDSLDPNSPYVKVYWGCGLPGEEIIEPFETGDFSLFDWQIDPTYPWSITTTSPYEGTYCMKSGGAGVANVVSNMTVTVDIPADGEMSFFGKISCESGWDYGYFSIDGTQMGSYTGSGSWGERTFSVTQGTHTFQWRYTKDSSVNSYDDCFYVDYVTFYKRPEPMGAGWHTYLEGEFNDALRSNLTDQPSFGYHYPTSITSLYNGFQLTKVSMFSDNLYGAVGGNYTVNIYQGGSTPGAGTLVSTKTVDLPVGLGQWVDWDLDTPVSVSGSQELWVIWHVNQASGMGYPAGMCNSDSNPNGDWWDGGSGWENYGGGVWTMRNYFTDRSGRSVVVGTAENANNVALEANAGAKISSDLRTFTKGDNTVYAESINPNAPTVPLNMDNTLRSFNHYRIYRTNCYNDGPYTEENTVLLATNWPGDTVYIDVEWADLEPGVYKWGVGCVYAGNRGEEVESEIAWSEPVNVRGDRAEFTYGFEGGLDGWTVIDVNASEGTWIHSDDNLGGYDYTTLAHGGTGFAMCYSFIDNVGAINTDSYLVSPQKYSIDANSTLSFWADNANDTYPESFSVCVATADNPTAADFTQIWGGEAKGGSNAKAETRHMSDRYDNWRSHNVDLSDYAGQEVWIAFHDVNYDQYEIWIDDVTVNAGNGGGGGTPGGTNPIQLERESEIVWSNCLDKDMYLTDGAVTVNVLLNSADNPEGSTVDFVNYNAAEQELYPVDQVVIDESGYYAFESFRRGIYQVTVQHDGYETVIDSVNIWNPIDLRYVLIEIIYGVSDLYVSSTGWAMWGAMGAPSGQGGGGGQGTTSFTEDFEGGLNGWTVIDVNAGEGTWLHSNNNPGGYDYTTHAHGGTGFAMCYSFVDYVGAYNTDSYLVTPQKYDIVNGSTLTFWADNANDSYPENFSVCVTTADNPTAADFTQVWSGSAKGTAAKADVRHDSNRYDNWRSHSIDLSAYAGQSVYIAFHDVNYDAYEVWIDDVALTAGAKNADAERHLESFKVLCTSIDGEPIYNANVPADQPFCQLATDELVAGDHYICKVAAMYSTGMSDWTEQEWQYIPCDNYAGTVNGVTIEGNEISWEYPGGGGGGQGGQGSAFSYDLEAGLPAGWNVIDANNDGNTWCLTSNIPSTWTYYAGMSLDWYRSGSNAICSGSYINGVGALNPDEYLVTEQVTLVNGSTFSFWAAATDENYAADHFGVFVSDNGTSDWTMVNEWTLTAKGGAKAGDPRASRDGNGNRLGSWHQYTVDLSAFAGQKYIAIRHFNCYDQYIMCVDDIELTAGAKANRNPWDLMMTFTAAEAGHYGVAYDGNNFYTSNWGYSAAAHNFYKYDLAGNMLEGFEISGCGTLRGITYDGTYFYGVANSSTVYCVDLANHSVVSTFTSAYGAMRGITYDPARDGFWVIGNWSGNLTLIDRTGAIQQTGPAPESASDLAYYKDENDVEHVFCFNNGTNDVVDWVIGNNAMGSSVFNFNSLSGVTGTSGGCNVASFNGKIAFMGNIQQDPNLIGIYELRDDNSTPIPTPTGDVLGAMIFADGEWEAFVEYPTNTYTYEGNAEEVCVRMVYNGTNNLPEGNIYFSMSCPECEPYMPGTITCEMPYDINIEQESDMSLKVWWGTEPAAPIEDWLYYDDGANVDAIGLTNGGTFYWGIKFPASSLAAYEGCSVTKVAYYDYTAHSGVVYIYQGSTGNGPSSNLIGTYNYTANGTEDWAEWNIAPVAFDNTQDLWIVMSNTGGGQYVAAMGNYTGDPNGTMLSTDGATWYTLDEATGGAISGTWNLRCFVSNQAKGAVESVEMPLPIVEGGELANAGIAKGGSFNLNRDRANLVKYNVYRSTEAAGEYTMIGSVTEDGSGYYEYIDTPVEAGTYYYQVRAEYDNECESEPALAAGTGNNYVSGTTVGDGVNENGMAIYPNPTKGNVTIEVAGMRHITVVSTLGQVVFDADIEGDNYIMNMSQYTAGMYTVRVVTENGVNVSRITVVR